MVKRIITITVIAIIFPILTLAAEFTASVNQNQAAIGKPIILKLKLSNASATSKPSTSLLKKYFNISRRGQSTNTTIINGSVSSSTNWTYTLQPKKDGNIIIPAISIDTSEGILKTEPITLSVGKASSLPSSDKNNSIVISAKVSKHNPYKNEPITYTVTLVSHYEMFNVSLSEIILEDAVIEQNGEPEIYSSTQNGIAVKVIKASYIITPLKSGTLTIPVSTIQGGIPTARKSRRFGSLFDPNFDPFDMMGDLDGLFGHKELKPFALATKPITLEVIPPVDGVNPWLPATSLKITENWNDLQTLKVGEPITRGFTIVAEGVSASQLPSLENQLGKKIKIYADQPILDESIKDGKITSWRQESYTLIPRQSGTIVLPEIYIKWWDVKEKKIAYTTIPERVLNIAEGEISNNYIPSVTQMQNNNITVPIQGLEANSTLQIETPTTITLNQDNRWFYAVITGLVAILSVVTFWIISLKQKIARLTEVKITNTDKFLSKTKMSNNIYSDNKKLENIKNPSDLKKYLQKYAYENWDLPQNTPLEEISKWVEKQFPEFKEDVKSLFKPLLAALYADKDIDIDKAKKHCASIIQSIQKKQTLNTNKKDELPNLNPS